MLKKIKPENILFLDIETVPEFEEFSHLSEDKQQLYGQKTKYQRKETYSAEEFYDSAGIWAEFGKIVCISVGFFSSFEKHRTFRIKSFFDTSEKDLLLNFKVLLEEHFSNTKHILCAHNGKEFDFPYIARRMIINNIKLPEKLNLFGKKPWEIAHIDTLELWKFGDYKHYTSLNLLTNILNIPSPKNDINGSDVAKVYYQENNLNRIVKYCERDTLAVAQLLLRFSNLKLLNDKEVIVI